MFVNFLYNHTLYYSEFPGGFLDGIGKIVHYIDGSRVDVPIGALYCK